MRQLLPRYRATWSDGLARIIHARTWQDARELAWRLEVPAGVVLGLVEAVE